VKKLFICGLIFLLSSSGLISAELGEMPDVAITLKPESETIIAQDNQVIVREHPKTKRPYVTIASGDTEIEEHTITMPSDTVSRPDYRILSYRVPKDIPPYNGPYSDRTKVYVFAGALIATGIATAAVGAAAPAAVGAASSGGGAYAVAGTTVGVTTLATALLKARPDPDEDEFTHTSNTRLVEFYGFEEDTGEVIAVPIIEN